MSARRKCRRCGEKFSGVRCNPCESKRATARVKTLRDAVRALGGVERARELARLYPPPNPPAPPAATPARALRGDASDELFQ